MSGIKPLPLVEFYWSLRGRGMTTGKLAEEIGCSGGAVRRLIGHHRRRRGTIWHCLRLLLTSEECALLGKVEQSSTWNTKNRPTSEIFSAKNKEVRAAGPDEDDGDDEEIEPVTMEAHG